MKIASHIEKFRRLDAMKRRLHPTEDCELVIWTAMNACTHLLNAALHHCGTTDEIDSFHTQVNGLYVVPDRESGTLRDVMHAPGDLMHVGEPPLARPVAPAVDEACAALRVIEALREPYVRGIAPVPEGAERTWENAYRQCVMQLSAVLDTASWDGP